MLFGVGGHGTSLVDELSRQITVVNPHLPPYVFLLFSVCSPFMLRFCCCPQLPARRTRTRTQRHSTEACAQAASNLTNANAEFVRQALVAPATVAEILEILYLGGDGDGGGGGVSDRGRKRAAACRLNSARVLRSIFSEADASDVAR